jgi:Sec-independent protein translocase protein TatA
MMNISFFLLLIPVIFVVVIVVVIFGLLKLSSTSKELVALPEELKDLSKLTGKAADRLNEAVSYLSDKQAGDDDVLDNLGDITATWDVNMWARSSWGASFYRSLRKHSTSPLNIAGPPLAHVRDVTVGEMPSLEALNKSWSLTRGAVAIKSAKTDMRILIQKGVAYIHLNGKFAGSVDYNNKTINGADDKPIGKFELPLALAVVGGIPLGAKYKVTINGKKACDVTLQAGIIEQTAGLTRVPLFKNVAPRMSRENRALILGGYFALDAIMLQQAGWSGGTPTTRPHFHMRRMHMRHH